MKQREENYDLLRIISTIAVIMIHVSSTWYNRAVANIADGSMVAADIRCSFFICIYNSLPRFAVPCFLMLSGAFILDNDENARYKDFYYRSFVKLGIPTIVFSVLYSLYEISIYCLGVSNTIGDLIKQIIKGAPMYHMWYLYMLIGVYAMAPVVIRFKNSISKENFFKISFCFLMLASVSHWATGETALKWDIGQAFEYLGYLMAGYCIRTMCRRKSSVRAAVMVLIGMLCELCAAGLQYLEMAAGIAETQLKYQIVAPYAPLIVLASVLTFYGFTLLEPGGKWGKKCATVSGLTFYIYLFHAGVWDVILKGLHLIKGMNFLLEINSVVWIPVFVAIVFLISWGLSRIYLWLWGRLAYRKN